jgi:hypothetical protein
MIKSSRIRWAWHRSRMVKRNAYMILMGMPEVKRPLGRRKRRWTNNIKMDLRERERWCCCTHWTDLVQGRDQCRALFNTVMDLWVPRNIEKCWSSYTTGGFAERAQICHGALRFLSCERDMSLRALSFAVCITLTFENFSEEMYSSLI